MAPVSGRSLARLARSSHVPSYSPVVPSKAFASNISGAPSWSAMARTAAPRAYPFATTARAASAASRAISAV